MLLTQTAQFLFVASLWGLTNPFIKRGASGVEKVTEKYKKASVWTRQWQEWKFLFRRWQYVLPLVLNLSGSVAYYVTLGHSDLTIAVPVVNALTFVMTIVGGLMLGERIEKPVHALGLFLILTGILLCISCQ